MLDDGTEQELDASGPGGEPTPPPHSVGGPGAADGEAGPQARWLSRPMVPLYLLGAVSLAVLVGDAVVIERAIAARRPPSAEVALAMVAPVAPTAAPARALAASTPEPDADDEPGEALPSPAPSPRERRGEPDAPKNQRTKGGQTVEQSFSRGCSTASVDGLSRQIVAEARCVDANMFALVPSRKNLVRTGNVFFYLEAPARDQLLKVLDANPNRTMTVNSAFRTVAQQYLLDRWARSGRCGIKLAARPGESNHETGLALDVKEPGTWRAALEERGFHWMGPSDPVHFDFQGPGAVRREGIDILAFQRLWNRNHPEDRIAENGVYGEPTETRVKKAPAAGFPQGPLCGAARPKSKAR